MFAFSRLMIRLAALAPFAVLAGCGDKISAGEARSCIEGAFAKKNGQINSLTGLFGKRGVMPTIVVSKVNVANCKESGPATYTCLVEYAVNFEGGDSDLNAIIGTLRGIAGEENELQQSYWRFAKGSSSFQCEKLDR